MNLQETYLSIKPQIDKRLKEFKEVNELQILKELLFCICTPQTDAHKAWNAVTQLWDSPKKGIAEIRKILRKNGVRFHNEKADRIVSALRNYSTPNHLVSSIKSLFYTSDKIKFARDTLAEIINGFGMKEASHFLRNIGYGDEVCILDRHILQKLKENKVIDEIPKPNVKKYIAIEQKMIDFAKKENIPVAALDLVFWYQAKKEIFK